MQRIFKYGGIQNITLTPDKELNILIYRMPSYVIQVMHFKKWSVFCGPPCNNNKLPLFQLKQNAQPKGCHEIPHFIGIGRVF